MPIKLNVGLAQKVGEANFGSRGASLNLEVELDSALISDPDRLKDRIRQLFAMVRASLAEELKSSTVQPAAPPTPMHPPATNGKTNGRAHSVRLATPPQIRKIQSLAEAQKLDLDTLLRERCQVQRPEELSVRKASDLIDLLKTPLHPQTV